MVCPLGRCEGGSAITNLEKKMELHEVISNIIGSCFCLANNYIQLKIKRKVRHQQLIIIVIFYSYFITLRFGGIWPRISVRSKLKKKRKRNSGS